MTRKDEDIDDLRRRIAEVDRRIIDAVAERMKLSSEIGRLKAAREMEIEDRAIEELVLARAKESGRRLGLEEGLVDQLFRLLVDHSKKTQMREGRDGEDSNPRP